MTTYDAREIARAVKLAAKHPSVAPLLNFYAQLARFQKPVFTECQSKGETDLRALVCHFPALIKLVARSGTELPTNFAVENLRSMDAQLVLLASTWEGGEALDPAARFYARAMLQPYAGTTCPFCNARPVAGAVRQLRRRWSTKSQPSR